MPVSQKISGLFENLVKSYKTSTDEEHHQIYPKLVAILREIRNNSSIHSDESLVAQLSTSAVVLMPNNPHFSSCLRVFLLAYQKQTNALNILADYSDSINEEKIGLPDDAQEQSLQYSSTTTSAFFKELQAAIKNRALRIEQKEKNGFKF